MKKIAKRSVEVEVQPEDISPLELLQPGKLNKRTVMHLLRKVDVKKVGIAAGGAAVVLSAVSLTGRYTCLLYTSSKSTCGLYARSSSS